VCNVEHNMNIPEMSTPGCRGGGPAHQGPIRKLSKGRATRVQFLRELDGHESVEAGSVQVQMNLADVAVFKGEWCGFVVRAALC
jgi:hypothetical protein